MKPGSRTRDAIAGRIAPHARRSSAPGAQAAPTPLALWALLPINAAALISAVYVAGSTTEPVLGSVLLATIGTINAALGAVLAVRLRGYEVRASQREHVRLGVDFDASIGGIATRVLDVSLGGALIAMPRVQTSDVPDAPRLEFTLQGFELSFESQVVRVSEFGRSAELALRFASGQSDMMARLGVALLTEADASHQRAVYRESLPVAA